MANTRPGRGRTSWFLWVSAAFLASALVTFVFYLAATRRSGAYGNALNLYATFVQLAISVASFVLDRRVGRRPVAGSDPDRLAQTLARIVREAATEALHQRGLRLPLPLRLRWRVLPTTSGAAATLLPPHLLGAEEDPQWPASGLVDAFRQLTDRRLLVLGEPGAGKSTLALLFTQAAARSADTVPVLLPLASWWPGTESVRDFALRQVPAEYPALAPDGEFDVDAFARLFDDGRVLLVLDGLDELSQAVIPVAIARFNDFAGTDGHPLVITCRTSEYAHAAAAGEPLTGTEVISIEPVTPQDTIGYLAAARRPDRTRWAPVLARLREEPAGALAKALSTPLTTGLARTIYETTGGDPAELCGMADVAEIEGHLLRRLLQAVYPDDGAGRGHERPLSLLAYYLEPKLAWWNLVRAVPPVVIASTILAGWALVGALAGALFQPFHYDRLHNALYGMVVAAAIGVITGLCAARNVARRSPAGGRPDTALLVSAAAARDSIAAVALVGGYLLLVATRAASGADAPALVAGTTFAGLGGLAVGLICNGLSAGRGLEPSRTSVGLRALPPWLARGVATALVLGLPVSVCVGAIAGVEYGGRNGISTGLTILAVICLALGATIGIGRWLGAPVPDQEPPSPAAVLRADRAALLVAALVSGLATGVAAGVFVNAVDALRLDVLAYASPWRTGLACGVVVFGVVLCGSGSPWFWFVLARMWFTAVRHRLPWNLIRFLDAATIDQILRTSGPVYQFRHKPLRDHLAKQYRRGRPSWWLIGHADGTPSTPDRGVHVGRWGAAGRAALSALALAALLAGAAVTIAPQLIRFTGIRDVRVDNEQARTLLRAADGMQPAHPVDALRLRIAAASVDSDQGARDDLAAYLRMRLAAPPYAVLRTNRVVASRSWVVTLDEHGVVTKWDLRAARPQGEEVDRRSFDVVALGQTGWVELFGLDGHARLVDLAGDRGPIDLGTAPDSVEAIGVTGWVVVTDSGTVTAWHLSAVAPKPVPLAEQSSAVRVVDATGWVVVLDHATATAWQPHEGALRSSILDYQVDGLRGQPYDIVELDQVDAGVRSQWDLPAYPAAPVEVDSRLGEVPQAVFSSLDGRWVFADRGDGTTVLDTRSTGSRGVRLTAEPALAPGPGAWVITSSGDTGAAAWNLAARPPARVPLGPPAAGVVDGPPPWIVVDAGSTRSAWNLAASPPQGVPLGAVAGTEVGVGGWLLVHPGGGAPMVGWRLDGIPTGPLPLRDGALQAQLSAGGDWAVVSFTDEAVESLTAVVQAPYPAPPLPAGAAADPVAYACGIARRGLTPAEWERYAPGIPYRKTCAG